jgi:hypothetical protein
MKKRKTKTKTKRKRKRRRKRMMIKLLKMGWEFELQQSHVGEAAEKTMIEAADEYQLLEVLRSPKEMRAQMHSRSD